MGRILAAAIILLTSLTGLRAADAPLCETLRRVIEAAEAGNRFADILGGNTGTYHESLVELEDAQFCLVSPDEYPTASWRCLTASAGKYNFALRSYGKLVADVESCLGRGWTAEKRESADFLRETRFAGEASVAEVRVMMSREVRPLKAWREYRVVIAVHSPRDD